MAKAARNSKFRHIYGEPAKIERQYLEVKQPRTSGEGQYVAANHIFWAVAKSGGGSPVYIRRHDEPGRVPTNVPLLSVQKGKTWDMDFNPFVDNMIATASDDCTCAVTSFPIEGLLDNIDQATVMLEGHEKKVVLCQFNPSASSILATGSFDTTVKVWNIETASCTNTLNDLSDAVFSVEWNSDGSRIAVTGKDKNLRLWDPRAASDGVQVVEAFGGAKSSKCFWVPDLNWVGAVGFSKTAKRQLRLWDLANLEKPIFTNDLDQAASVLMPRYDADNSVLYLAGKGEGNIQYFELVNDERMCHALGVYRDPEPQKGGGWVPKKGLDVWKCEVQRFLKLTGKALIPISFIVPRKVGADVFQADIFPDAYAGKPALTADQWIGGETKKPILMSLDPKNRKDEGPVQQGFEKKKTYQQLSDENERLRARIIELEARLESGDEPKPEQEPEPEPEREPEPEPEPESEE